MYVDTKTNTHIYTYMHIYSIINFWNETINQLEKKNAFLRIEYTIVYIQIVYFNSEL